MTRRRKARPLESTPRFLDRLREALSHYADGVHALSAAATPEDQKAEAARLALPIPPSLAEVYALSDGLWLFDDTVHVLPLAALSVVDRRFIACGVADGARLLCDADGRIYEEDDDGDRVLAAADLEEALLVWIAREALLLDFEGEWKEVFDPSGELLPAIQRKRNEVARRRAPHAARWLLEAAELALALDGKQEEAEAFLRQAIEADPEAPAPREILGSLLIARGVVPEGAIALAAAAEHGSQARRAERAAAAAAACARAGDEATRAKMASLAIHAEPAIVARLAADAEAALASGRLEDADRLASLVSAIAGDTDALPARLRVRGRLRPIS